MDRQTLANLLLESQSPDTQKIKAITAELQKNWFPHADCLLLLIEIVCAHDNVTIKQQAAVQAARLVPKHWKAIGEAQKSAVRSHILEATLKEQNTRCRHLDARLIGDIATADYDNESEWPGLVDTLFNLSSSNEVNQREVGSYIMFSTIEANPLLYSDHTHRLLELFSHTIKDPQSADVQINTMLSIGALLMLIDTDEDEACVQAIQNLFPAMAAVLRSAAEAGDEEKCTQGFEVLQQFLTFESSFVGPHLKNLLQFMTELAGNSNAEEQIRAQALSFLAQAVHYRRMKIQSMRDMAALLVTKSIEVLAEVGLDDDDVDETSAGRAALALLNGLGNNLPPRLVMLPLLDAFPKYATSENPDHRRAGILALGTCAEGAPDFVMTQLKSILPHVVQLLNDPNQNVRRAALVGLTDLAEEMSDDIAVEHEAIIPAVLKNLQAAMTQPADEEAAQFQTGVLRSVCAAFDAVSDGIKADVMKIYAPQVVEPMGRLLEHSDPKIKTAAAAALGAIAQSLGQEFTPYFEKTMSLLGQYINIKDSEDDLALRSGVCDSVGRIAIAVGAQTFQPYVVDLMKSTEEALKLDNERLRESCFILWSSLARVYEDVFRPFLPGVFSALFEALKLEEEEVALDLTEEEKAIVGDAEELVTGGKRIKLRQAPAATDGTEMDDNDGDEEDWEDFIGSAECLEKEVAVEVLGDIITHACGPDQVQQYLEQSIEIARNFIDHPYEGLRKASVGTLWRAYARVWAIVEEETGSKWGPGFPPSSLPNAMLTKLGGMCAKPTLDLWADESDRAVVTEIHRSIASVLKACGPAILAQEDAIKETVSVLTLIITRSHPCQQDMGDEEEDQNVEGSSEYDWLIIDTAFDVIIGLSVAMGPDFGELWKIFSKPVLKFASSQEAVERSTTVGTIAECTGNMGASVTPYTGQLLTLLLRRLTDEDPETKSNAAYGIGRLISNSADSATYLASFPDLISKLEPLLQVETGGHRIFDNVAGCLCRMITAHPDKIDVAQYLPYIVQRLPLTEDYEENKPIYSCIFTLFQQGHPVAQQLTPSLIPIFEKILGPPEDQLDDATRHMVLQAVQVLHGAHPELFQAHPQVLKLANVA